MCKYSYYLILSKNNYLWFMKLELIRFDHDIESTSGIISINYKFECYCLEDQHQEVKIKGETRIPEGTYKLGIRKELTSLTKKYISKYPWFERHIEILNVPNFTGIYLHIGNFDEDTMGCILVADMIENQGGIEDRLYKSTQAYKRFYEKVYPLLKFGEKSTITIRSIWNS